MFYENCLCSLNLVFFVFFIIKKNETKSVFCVFLILIVVHNKKQFSKTENKQVLSSVSHPQTLNKIRYCEHAVLSCWGSSSNLLGLNIDL